MSFPHEAALSRQPSGQVGLYEEDGVVLASSLVPRQMSSSHCRRRCDRNTKPACGAHTDEVNDETIKLTKVSPVLINKIGNLSNSTGKPTSYSNTYVK